MLQSGLTITEHGKDITMCHQNLIKLKINKLALTYAYLCSNYIHTSFKLGFYLIYMSSIFVHVLVFAVQPGPFLARDTNKSFICLAYKNKQVGICSQRVRIDSSVALWCLVCCTVCQVWLIFRIHNHKQCIYGIHSQLAVWLSPQSPPSPTMISQITFCSDAAWCPKLQTDYSC